MRFETGDAIRKIERDLDATELVVLSKRDWDKIKESPLADGVAFVIMRSIA